MTKILEVKNIYHAYDETLVAKNISFKLKKGSIGCLLGQSGCGKTTVLRVIAGFEDIIDGEVRMRGEVVSKKGWSLSPEKRNVNGAYQVCVCRAMLSG